MRMTSFLAVALLAAPLTMPAQSPQNQSVQLEAMLFGDNENPPVDTEVTGDVTVWMDFSGSFDDDSVFEDVGEAFTDGFNSVVDFFTGDDGGEVPDDFDNIERVTVRMRADIRNASGKTFTGGHIHDGGSGENGPVVVNFEVPETTVGSDSTSVMTTVTLTGQMDVETAFRIVANPGDYYVNLHTTDNPSGEARGQLQMSDATSTERIERDVTRLREDLNTVMMMLSNLQENINNIASDERAAQFDRIDQNVANIGRRVGLNTQSQQVVGSAE